MTLRSWIALVTVGLLLAGCGGDQSSDSLAGTYKLVKDDSMLEQMKGPEVDEATPAAEAMLDRVTAMLENMSMNVELKPDGTFAVDGSMGMAFSATGTWAREGEHVVLTATHEDGKPRETPEASKWVVGDGTLTMPKGEKGSQFDIVLRRE